MTTRRSFLRYGAAGLTTVAGASMAADRLWSATAQAADPFTKDLYINEGRVRMIDGNRVFMRGFGRLPNTSVPMVPGLAIGHGATLRGTLDTVMEEQMVTVNITNGLADDHAFAMPEVLDEPVLIPGTPPGTQPTPVSVTFTAPRAGTYLYFDPLAGQRILGLHGVMVVMPKDGTMRPYGDDRVTAGELPVPPYFTYQFVWVLHDIDPVWGERALARTLTTGADNRVLRPDVPELLPRYFTINGVSGEESTTNERTVPEIKQPGTGPGPAPNATLIRIVNMGAVTHSCHFHGNHVFVVTDGGNAVERTDPVVVRDANGVPVIDPTTGQPVVTSKPIALEKDVIRMPPQSVKEMLLPGHIPIDQYPPYEQGKAYLNQYPMHCHAEMSQTAGGGNYPSGMLTDWELIGAFPDPRPFV